ncbi:NAD-dependent epimerase/dehydratase family protein [Lentilactobacillus hilgardii]|uniref:NAD-dependent epimerase/dehydratase family protein n=1 Tax=Lentilactobacillus hilgardii TaxID=1588 RepID=UPI0021A7A8C3|nr:NAD-dependent epimerase/dehydratase family protein [Lentilactobacillus hilgardii]MCT3400760.1 NAD-dependent epimerase/dehydratase family protein [Lentilactobacillus hilgardii]
MIITVVGGSGFVGSGMLKELSQFDDFELYSISRSGRPDKQVTLPNVKWLKGDVSQPGDWERIIAKSDWVIDCVGILFPNPLTKTSHWKNSIQPAESLINTIHRQNIASDNPEKTHFLFVSANYGPFFMAPYIKAKLEVEKDMARLLPKNSIVVYPGIVTDSSKPTTRLLENLAKALTLSLYFKRLRFVSRDVIAQETVRILTGETSFLTERVD